MSATGCGLPVSRSHISNKVTRSRTLNPKYLLEHQQARQFQAVVLRLPRRLPVSAVSRPEPSGGERHGVRHDAPGPAKSKGQDVDKRPAEDILSHAAASARLGIEDHLETFQNLGVLITDSPMPLASTSPAPILSPTDSVYSDVTVSSPSSLMSAASTSSDTRFFAPDFDVIGIGSPGVKGECGKDNRYVEMRRRNNLASRRSRQTRREKEREMEQQLKQLHEENASLRLRAQTMEELVEKTKSIIMQVVANKHN